MSVLRMSKAAFLTFLLLLQSQAYCQDAKGVYEYWGDDKPNNNVSKEVFLDACEKVVSLDTFLYSTGAQFLNNKSYELIVEAGPGVVSEPDVYISKSGKCMLSYKVNGVYKGTTVNTTIYCPVFQISPREDGKLKVSGLNFMNCSKS